MKCDEFDNRIHDLLDLRVGIESDHRLADHAIECGRCRAVLNAYQDLWAGLDAFEAPTLDDDFAMRTVQQATGTQPTHSRQFPAWIFAAVAIAASLLIAATLIFRQTSQQPTPGGVPIVVQPQDPAADPGPTPEPPTNAPSQPWPEASPLALIAAGKLPLDWQILLSEEQLSTMDSITGGIEPITSNLSAALRAIRSTIPLGRERSADASQEDSVRLLTNLNGGCPA